MFKRTSGNVRLLRVCAAAVALVLIVETGWCQLDVAHQMLRDNGLQAMNLVYSFRGDYPFDPDRWDESNFSAIDLGQGRQNIGQCEFYGFNWLLQGNDANELTPDPCTAPGTDGPYDYRLFYEISHEPDITVNFSPTDVDYAVLADLADRYAEVRAFYPGVPVTTKLRGGPGSLQHYADSAIQAYIDQVQPDILSHGGYWFFYGGADPDPHHEHYFTRLEQWRQLAVANDLPYQTDMQIWYGSDDLRIPSESDARFNQFTTLAYGYKILGGFIYDGWGTGTPLTPVLFDDPNKRGTDSPTALFYQYAASNTEVLNLGSSLVYLLSTGVRYVTEGTLPDRTVAWQSGASDPYITGIDANDAAPDDILVGYFEPMLESDDGPLYSDQVYFMIVNCRHEYDETAVQSAQAITVNLDFAASGITSLQRLNRLTGDVELIVAGGTYDGLTYTQTGATTYRMELTLPGGTGDLFKFHTGALFVNGKTCAEMTPGLGDLNGDCYVNVSDFAMMARAWFLCNDPEDESCTIDCSDPANADVCR